MLQKHVFTIRILFENFETKITIQGKPVHTLSAPIIIHLLLFVIILLFHSSFRQVLKKHASLGLWLFAHLLSYSKHLSCKLFYLLFPLLKIFTTPAFATS